MDRVDEKDTLTENDNNVIVNKRKSFDKSIQNIPLKRFKEMDDQSNTIQDKQYVIFKVYADASQRLLLIHEGM